MVTARLQASYSIVLSPTATTTSAMALCASVAGQTPGAIQSYLGAGAAVRFFIEHEPCEPDWDFHSSLGPILGTESLTYSYYSRHRRASQAAWCGRPALPQHPAEEGVGPFLAEEEAYSPQCRGASPVPDCPPHHPHPQAAVPVAAFQHPHWLGSLWVRWPDPPLSPS